MQMTVQSFLQLDDIMALAFLAPVQTLKAADAGHSSTFDSTRHCTTLPL